MFFADTGTLPPPFNLIPNPKSLYDLATWVFYRCCKSSAGVSARCSAYRCCYLDRTDSRTTYGEEEYQKLMSTLIQRYFLAVEDARKESKKDASSAKGRPPTHTYKRTCWRRNRLIFVQCVSVAECLERRTSHQEVAGSNLTDLAAAAIWGP